MQDVNTSYLLPHRYKRIGWGVIGIFFVLYVITDYGFDYGMLNWFKGIHGTILMIGLTLVITSREEKEDEMIRLIRLKSFQYGLYTTVLIEVVGMVLGFIGIVRLPFPPINAFGEINGVLILILIIYQFNLYRLRSDEE